jgi:hypothetical protein
MSATLNPVAASYVSCKCCSGQAPLYDVADFNKNCEAPRNPNVLPVAGVPVYYYRCKECSFIFTTFFDNFSSEDFSKHIYNDQYILISSKYGLKVMLVLSQIYSAISKASAFWITAAATARWKTYCGKTVLPTSPPMTLFLPITRLNRKSNLI